MGVRAEPLKITAAFIYAVLSPSAPAGTASSSTGMLAAAEIALTSSAEVVNDSITHCAATVCIHEPTLLTNCADHNLLKSGSRIGAQPDRDDRASGDDELSCARSPARRGFHCAAAWTPGAAATRAKRSCTNWTTAAPSPTAVAQRLIEPARTSPAA
jgi:hypothetical protein